MSVKRVKCNVVMLPTNKKAPIVIIGSGMFLNRTGLWTEKAKYQHLYILSNETPKKGDWVEYLGCISPIVDVMPNEFPGENRTYVFIMDGKHKLQVFLDECRKVIATTDELETSDEVFHNTFKQYLPQPSESFIEKFVKEYNKGNIITEVMVEYTSNEWSKETKMCMMGYGDNPDDFIKESELKINPKDNTITISKVKDSWSTEEMLEFANSCRIHDNKHPNEVWTIQQLFDKWVK